MFALVIARQVMKRTGHRSNNSVAKTDLHDFLVMYKFRTGSSSRHSCNMSTTNLSEAKCKHNIFYLHTEYRTLTRPKFRGCFL